MIYIKRLFCFHLLWASIFALLRPQQVLLLHLSESLCELLPFVFFSNFARVIVEQYYLIGFVVRTAAALLIIVVTSWLNIGVVLLDRLGLTKWFVDFRDAALHEEALHQYQVVWFIIYHHYFGTLTIVAVDVLLNLLPWILFLVIVLLLILLLKCRTYYERLILQVWFVLN